jgi:hypothetical protein
VPRLQLIDLTWRFSEIRILIVATPAGPVGYLRPRLVSRFDRGVSAIMDREQEADQGEPLVRLCVSGVFQPVTERNRGLPPSTASDGSAGSASGVVANAESTTALPGKVNRATRAWSSSA